MPDFNTLVAESLFGAFAAKKTANQSLEFLAEKRKITTHSTFSFYKFFAGQNPGFTVPAFNLRVLTFDISRLLFRLAKKYHTNAFILEIARSELEYTNQSPLEFKTAVLAASLAENYQGPLFLQADHLQVHKEDFIKNPEEEKENLKKLILSFLKAGFYNLDLDGSTLVNLEGGNAFLRQKQNIEVTSELLTFIKKNVSSKQEITIGGEIGHIGDQNSTASDLDAFMQGFSKSNLSLQKISAQTGATHGGIVQKDGSLKKIEVDFHLLEELGQRARDKYGLFGIVQHAASTLPFTDLERLTKSRVLEVHLATKLQNIIFDNLPKELLLEIDNWTRANCQDKRLPAESEAQFFYRNRKKALGEFKKTLFELRKEEKEPVLIKLTAYFESVFESLNLQGVQTNAFS